MHYDLLTIYLTSAHDTYAKPKCVQICYSINRHDMYYTPTTDKQENGKLILLMERNQNIVVVKLKENLIFFLNVFQKMKF